MLPWPVVLLSGCPNASALAEKPRRRASGTRLAFRRDLPDVATLIADGALDRGKSAGSDGWGQPWKIECDRYDATIISKGPDKKADTEDDIRVPPA